MSYNFEIGDFGEQEEGIDMSDVFFGLFDEFFVEVLDSFELFIDTHGEEFLLVDNTVCVFDSLFLLRLGLLFVFLSALFAFFVELVIFADGFSVVIFADGFGLVVAFLTRRFLV